MKNVMKAKRGVATMKAIEICPEQNLVGRG
jgi:hypothetical protein